ncbi:MAG: hypothetical protein IPK01_02930 [Acidobacteria bacterium]|nr:hypothetical protein [Acidobacteriota bacterium]
MQDIKTIEPRVAVARIIRFFGSLTLVIFAISLSAAGQSTNPPPADTNVTWEDTM